MLDEVFIQPHHVHAQNVERKVMRGLLGKLPNQRLQRSVGLRMRHARLETNSGIVAERVWSPVTFRGR